MTLGRHALAKPSYQRGPRLRLSLPVAELIMISPFLLLFLFHDAAMYVLHIRSTYDMMTSHTHRCMSDLYRRFFFFWGGWWYGIPTPHGVRNKKIPCSCHLRRANLRPISRDHRLLDIFHTNYGYPLAVVVAAPLRVAPDNQEHLRQIGASIETACVAPNFKGRQP